MECLTYICELFGPNPELTVLMKRKSKDNGVSHIRTKTELYERFLFNFLPRLTSLYAVTRINVYDVFAQGLNQAGSQGTPYGIFEAISKQRLHLLRNNVPVKPFSLCLFNSGNPGKNYHLAVDSLTRRNKIDNCCKLSSCKEPFALGIEKLLYLRTQKPAGEKDLILIDPIGISGFSLTEIFKLVEKNFEVILYLPLTELWELHTKGRFTEYLAGIIDLKSTSNRRLEASEPSRTRDISFPEFSNLILQLFSADGRFYTAMDPRKNGQVNATLLGISRDAFMMEKVLGALQSLQSDPHEENGKQMKLFESERPQCPSSHTNVLELIASGIFDNQQLYSKALSAGILPSQVVQQLKVLFESRQLEINNHKGELLADFPANCINFTAFKAPKPSYYFKKSGGDVEVVLA